MPVVQASYWQQVFGFLWIRLLATPETGPNKQAIEIICLGSTYLQGLALLLGTPRRSPTSKSGRAQAWISIHGFPNQQRESHNRSGDSTGALIQNKPTLPWIGPNVMMPCQRVTVLTHTFVAWFHEQRVLGIVCQIHKYGAGMARKYFDSIMRTCPKKIFHQLNICTPQHLSGMGVVQPQPRNDWVWACSGG